MKLLGYDDLTETQRGLVVGLRQTMAANAAEERIRQDKRWGYLREFGGDTWLTILGEEVGELAEALATDPIAIERAIDEALQVAACALQVAEALRDGRVTNPAHTSTYAVGLMIAAGAAAREQNDAAAAEQ